MKLKEFLRRELKKIEKHPNKNFKGSGDDICLANQGILFSNSLSDTLRKSISKEEFTLIKVEEIDKGLKFTLTNNKLEGKRPTIWVEITE